MTPVSQPAVTFTNVSKVFGDVRAVDDVSLAVEKGAFFTFLGPSGCGKTTSLRLIAGFEQPSQGEVRIGGRSVVGVPAYRRPVNMVFQHYALFPHLDVAGNVAYGLRQRRPRPSAAEVQRQLGEMLELVRLPGFERRRPHELSGGQQQRVAIARALARDPDVLLLDEPFSAVDQVTRRRLHRELAQLRERLRMPIVLVTHDLEEAVYLADQVLLLSRHPARVADFPEVDCPRSRNDATLSDSNFVHLKAHCLEVFQREVRRA